MTLRVWERTAESGSIDAYWSRYTCGVDAVVTTTRKKAFGAVDPRSCELMRYLEDMTMEKCRGGYFHGLARLLISFTFLNASGASDGHSGWLRNRYDTSKYSNLHATSC